MRRLLFVVVVAAVASFAPAAQAGEPSSKCGSENVKTGTDGENSASVCFPGGAVTIRYVGGTNAYIVADGNSGNPDPSDGYVGVSDQGGAVCAADGDYTYGPNKGCVSV